MKRPLESKQPILSNQKLKRRGTSRRSFYNTGRDLHLYVGLFISPFVLIFAISVIFLNHNWETWDPAPASAALNRKAEAVLTPPGFAEADRQKQVELARVGMDELGVTGEVGFVRRVAGTSIWEINVLKPGQETVISLDLAAQTASIRDLETGFWGALIYLHKSPGPHNAAIRGNWSYTRWWQTTADLVVYLLLFVSVSGIYLWAVLKAERRIGLVLLGFGTVSFVFVVYSVSMF